MAEKQKAPTQVQVPKLRVQRQGKKFRIVYDESRGLARFESGDPCDGGGFEDVWEDGIKTVDGQLLAMMKLTKVMDGQVGTDPEEENIGA